MERRLKERLIGASVLVLLAVIFIPMALDDSQEREPLIGKTNIPQKPDGEFSSRLIPLPQPEDIIPPAPETEEAEMEEPAIQTAPIITSMEDPATSGQTLPPHEMVAAKGIIVPAEGEPPPTVPPRTAAALADNTQTAVPPQGVNDGSHDKKGLTAWVVQVGSFAIEENANTLNDRLRTAGYRSFVQPVKNRNTLSYRVRVGPEILRSEALKQQSKLQEEMNLQGIVLDYP